MAKRVTLADVARRAGVSPTAASLVLNERPGSRLSAEAAERIREAARALDYRPNPAAQSLRSGKSRTVGFLSDDVTVTRYASAMIRGALDVAEEHDHTVLISETGSSPERLARAASVMMDRRPDGVVIGLMGSKELCVPDVLAGVRTIVLNGRSTQAHPFVLRDEIGAGYRVIEHLVEQGHRRIALLGDARELRTDPALSVSIGDRFTGLESAMSAAGLEFVVRHVEEDWEPARGYEGTRELLRSGTEFTALVTLNDRLAFGAYQALAEAGLRIPQDVSVASFDDDVIATYVRPALTTARIPYEEMGRAAMRMVLGQEEPEPVFVPMPLQIRDSVSAPGRG